MYKIALLFFSATSLCTNINFPGPMNFITVADNEHMPWVPGLIESIKRHNPRKEINILVFDIGLLPQQIRDLESRYGVKVVPIEMVHPDLCKKFVVRPNGRLARGWYAWKPVAFYQALQYFDYFIHIDCSKRINGPCDDIFACIVYNGYFFMDVGHLIRPMTTSYVIDKFNLDNRILDLSGLEAGFQGISKQVLDSYVKPMYELAHDLRNFEDDGTAAWGFGGGRHDQTLFSILARLNNFTIYGNSDKFGPNIMNIGKYSVPFQAYKYVYFKNYNENPLAKEYCLF